MAMGGRGCAGEGQNKVWGVVPSLGRPSPTPLHRPPPSTMRAALGLFTPPTPTTTRPLAGRRPARGLRAPPARAPPIVCPALPGGDDSASAAPAKMSVEEACSILRVEEGSSFDAVLAARDARVAAAGSDSAAVAQARQGGQRGGVGDEVGLEAVVVGCVRLGWGVAGGQWGAMAGAHARERPGRVGRCHGAVPSPRLCACVVRLSWLLPKPRVHVLSAWRWLQDGTPSLKPCLCRRRPPLVSRPPLAGRPPHAAGPTPPDGVGAWPAPTAQPPWAHRSSTAALPTLPAIRRPAASGSPLVGRPPRACRRPAPAIAPRPPSITPPAHPTPNALSPMPTSDSGGV